MTDPLTSDLVQRLLVCAIVSGSIVAVWRVSDTQDTIRRRLLFGIPIGTVVTMVVVMCVYLFIQGGISHWRTPVTLPFRAWSYFSPVGILTAGFSHFGPSHLIGNLVGVAVLGTIVEYNWAHYPQTQGAQSFATPWLNPYVRGFCLFPLILLIVGILSAIFSIGPVIGFSGVVYFLAGAAVIRYPLGTVVALSGADALRLGINALESPVSVSSGRAAFISPWWADIAIQGHAIGILGGILAGIVVFYRKCNIQTSPGRLWIGVVLVAAEQSLWAVYWYRGTQTFVLYRALGVALISILGIVVVFSWQSRGKWKNGDRDIKSLIGRAGLPLLIIALLVLAVPAIPYNLTTVGDTTLPGETVQVREYQLTYAENIPNGLISEFDIEIFSETTAVNASGVIVSHPRYGIWTTAVSKGELALRGQKQVPIGGVQWRTEIQAERDGWTVTGNGTVYRIRLRTPTEQRIVFQSPPQTAGPVINGRHITAIPTVDGYDIVVRGNVGVTRRMIPAQNQTKTIGGIQFSRTNNSIIAKYNQTTVEVLTRETYR